MKTLISTLVLSFLMLMAFCQDLKINFDPITIPSPNAASLGVYGEVPVDLCHGLTNISIPIYEIKSRNLAVPMSINYRGSGLKLNQYPSWVGQNWTLFAGGAITRVTKGIPDECSMILQQPYTWCLQPRGYFYNYSLLDKLTWMDYDEIKDNHGLEVTHWDYNKLCNDFLDTEPDEFVFNFNGIHGKFYLDHHGKWQVASKAEIKVLCGEEDIKYLDSDYQWPINMHGERMFHKFTLITDDGTKYIFGGVRDAIEFTRQEKHNSYEFPVATTWNLTKIVSHTGNDSIVLEYERNFDDLILHVYNPIEIFKYNWLGSIIDSADNEIFKSFLVEPSYLKRIVANNQTIEFKSQKANNSLNLNISNISSKDIKSYYYTSYQDMRTVTSPPMRYSSNMLDWLTVTRKLDSIVVYNNLNEKFKLFKFDYIEDPTERLKLQSFRTVIPNSENSPEYFFEYYPSMGFPYSDDGTDHWGYAGQWAVIPPYNPDFAGSTPKKYDLDFLNDESALWDYFQGRKPNNWPEMYLSDVLKKIVYPTGGFSEFEYEQHEYSFAIYKEPGYDLQTGYPEFVAQYRIDTTTSKLKAGGLRIKKIINNDTNGNEEIKEYFYVNNYLGSDTPESIAEKLSSGLCANKMAQSPNEMFTVLNPYLKKAVGNFSNYYAIFSYENAYLNSFSNNPYIPLSFSEGNPITYHEVVERNYGNGYTKYIFGVPQKTFEYGLLDQFPLTAYNQYYCNFSSLERMRNHLEEKSIYCENGEILKNFKYSYNNYYKPASEIRTRSLGFRPYSQLADYKFLIGSANIIYIYNNQLVETVEESYFQDMTFTNTTTTMYDAIYDKFPATICSKNSDGVFHATAIQYSSDFVINNPSNDFEYALLGLQQNHIIVPIQVTKSNSEGKFDEYKCFSERVIKPAKTNKLNTDGTYYESIRFNAYDDFGNLLEFTPINGLNSGLIWGYNATKVIAKVVNASSNEIFHDSFEYQIDRFNEVWNSGGSGTRTLVSETSRTGKQSLKFSGVTAAWSGVSLKSSITVEPGKKYVLSCWYFGQPGKSAYINWYDWTHQVSYEFEKVCTGQWEYMEHVITAPQNCTEMRIYLYGHLSAGADLYYDDVRFHPADAQMTTYTHDPLIGMTSQTDPNGQTIYYEYDDLGRLVRIRDHENNLLQEYKYNYATQ